MMHYPKLIILYGRFQTDHNTKQQRMINGESTCMYREIASKYGEIVYLAPQDCIGITDRSIPNKRDLIKYLLRNPDAVIWSVKHDPEKDMVLRQIGNPKAYYSCCAYNMYNKYCDISLVDTTDRVKHNGVLWIKGKDPTFWKPIGGKYYNLLIMGHRADKNELWLLNELEKSTKLYSILWIGGMKHKGKIKSKHDIKYSPFYGPHRIAGLVPQCDLGVILSEHPAEGFPQSFLEMTMCGVPVLYLQRPGENKIYTDNALLINDKRDAIKKIDYFIENSTELWYNETVRDYAVKHYATEECYKSILKGLRERN